MYWLAAFKYVGYGWLILVVAVVVNGLANAADIITWYGYISGMTELGFTVATRSLSILDVMFLVVIYPGILGSVVYFIVSYLT